MGRLKPGATAEQARAQLESVFQQSVVEHRAARQAQARRKAGMPIWQSGAERLSAPCARPGRAGRDEHAAMTSRASLYLLLGVVASGAIDRLRQCGEPAAGAGGGAAERDRRATGSRREPLAPDPAVVDRKRAACDIGGALGSLFALWIKDGLLAVSDWGGRGMRALEPRLDLRVLGFTMALSLLTGNCLSALRRHGARRRWT